MRFAPFHTITSNDAKLIQVMLDTKIELKKLFFLRA
jgi:hypothetical protein